MVKKGSHRRFCRTPSGKQQTIMRSCTVDMQGSMPCHQHKEINSINTSTMKNNKLTYEEAHRLFRYDPKTGKLYWKIRPSNNVLIGRDAGSEYSDRHTRYRRIFIKKKSYMAHRIIWLMKFGEWPKNEIDHLDGNGLNNCISNLRDVSGSVNCRNRKMRSDNKFGATGIRKNKNRWVAMIRDHDGQLRHIGSYKSKDDAITAYRSASNELGGTERHGRTTS